jgi:hypothetical protein
MLPALFAVVVVHAACAAIAQTAMADHRAVAVALAFDLTVTASAAFWWLAVRPGHARPRTLVRVAAIGFVAAKLLVGLHALGALGALAELIVLVAFVVRLRRVVTTTHIERRRGHGMTFALATGLGTVVPVPPIAHGLAVEVSAAYLAMTGWFRRAPTGVSMHRSTGYLLIVGTLCALAAIETALAHVVIVQVAPTAAVVTTVLSVYGLVWLLGHAHAVRLQPARVIDGALVIERGVLARVAVPVGDIASIDTAPVVAASPTPGTVDVSLGGANITLALRAPATVHGLFGRIRRADRLLLSIDDVDALRALVAT